MFRAQARRHADPIAPRLKIQGHQDSVDQTFKAQPIQPSPARVFFQTLIPHFDGGNDDIRLNFGVPHFQAKPNMCPSGGQVINELYRDHGLEIDQADSCAQHV